MVRILKSKHPRYSFEVAWKEGGVGRRKFFRARREAEDWAGRKKAELLLLAPVDTGVTAEELAAVMEARRKGLVLGELVRRPGRGMETVSLGDLIERRMGEVLQARRRPRYVASLEGVFRRLVQVVPGERMVDSISAGELAGLIFGYTAAGSVSRTRAVLSGLFACGVRQKVLGENPVEALPRVSPDRDGEVSILSVEEMDELWAVCLDVVPVLAPSLGLALWAGLRPAEIAGARWVDARRETGVFYVGGLTSKTRQRRLVTMTDRLVEALERREGAVGKILPRNHRRLWDELRRAAGWQGTRGDGPGRPWRRNVLRHSFVSYHLAWFQDAGRTALEAGHSQTVLFRHYRDLVSRGEAGRWWEKRE